MRLGASSQVTVAVFLVIGLIIGAALVFASIYVIGGLSSKTSTLTSTELVISTQSVTLSSIQSTTTTMTATTTLVQTQSVTQTVTTTTTGWISSSGPTGASGSNLITAAGSLTVPSGNGPGLLVISVANDANSPITGIQVAYTSFTDTAFVAVTCMGETPAATGCGGLAGPDAACTAVNAGSTTAPVPFCIAGGTEIDAATPLAVGGQISAAENVLGPAGANLVSGTAYSMTLTVDFANGGTHTQPLSVVAQL